MTPLTMQTFNKRHNAPHEIDKLLIHLSFDILISKPKSHPPCILIPNGFFDRGRDC